MTTLVGWAHGLRCHLLWIKRDGGGWSAMLQERQANPFSPLGKKEMHRIPHNVLISKKDISIYCRE